MTDETNATVDSNKPFYQIDAIEIDRLKPYKNNARKLSDTAISKVAASIRNYGFRQPVVADKDLIIIAGHTRLLAARLLGLKYVPVHIADTLSLEQARAYRLADNRVADETSFDDDILRLELPGLEGQFTGFDAAELEALSIAIPDTEENDSTGSGPDGMIKCPKCGHKFSEAEADGEEDR
jgi:hypothetical protein